MFESDPENELIGIGKQWPAGSRWGLMGSVYIIPRPGVAKGGDGSSLHKDRNIQKEEKVFE